MSRARDRLGDQFCHTRAGRMAVIFFVNYFLDSRGIDMAVGIGPVSLFDIGSPWNTWGLRSFMGSCSINLCENFTKKKYF